MKFIKQVSASAVLIAFVAVACNKDSVLNQAELKSPDQTSASLVRKCSSHEYNEALMQADPTFRENQRALEEFTARYVAENRVATERTVTTIPVVVHVIYKTGTQNISDAQVLSQIAVLNADFRRLNADKTKTPAAFAGVAADPEVTFCLAKQDPNGKASTGIERKLTTTTSFLDNDYVKYTSKGGLNAWNSAKYLNLWVCNLGGGLLGYAQFPGGAAATDGVVILYSAFGNTGTVAAPYNTGRTATHEVGHWLNLRHIWGDDLGACTGSDLVTDTPNQASENYGCPTYPHVTCSNGTAGDMFMNYMDYTNDACMNLFTTGQKTRMKALFTAGGLRAAITTSVGCNQGN